MEYVIKVFMISLTSIIPIGGIFYLVLSLKAGKIISREPSALLACKTVSREEDRKSFWISWSALFIFFLIMTIIFIFHAITKWKLPIREYLTF